MKTFRVMQFNMQFGQIWEDQAPDTAPIRIEETVAEIRRHNPDVLILQEVEHAGAVGTRTPFPPHYTHLRAELQDYDSVFSLPDPDPRELPFGIGLAIFARAPLTGFSRHVLPSPPIPFEFGGEMKTPTDRLLISVNAGLFGRSVRLFNVHLLAFFMLRSSSREHPLQRARVAELLAQSSGPTLIGGDFNVSGHESLVEQMDGIGYRTVQQKEITWRRRPYVLDHIFHNNQLYCLRHQVVPTLASDHHVLLADMGFI
jgi:endonuclease/exonuclease/phosphatase family metal-dependent hydrolase